MSLSKHFSRDDKKKADFFLAASHQLKTPLAIIEWCIQITLESKTLDPKDRDMLSKALSQADALRDLITDMLYVVKIDNSKDLSKTYVPVDVNQVLEEAIKQYEPIAHKRHVHLIRESIECLPTVFVGEGYFRQAVINLIDNAIKYSPEKGKVEIQAEHKHGEIHISVTDEGIGMTEADQANLFQEFFRAAEAQEIAHDGTGLGLVLVKHVIEEFGGRIEVKTKFHQGSTFTIILPVIASANR